MVSSNACKTLSSIASSPGTQSRDSELASGSTWRGELHTTGLIYERTRATASGCMESFLIVLQSVQVAVLQGSRMQPFGSASRACCRIELRAMQSSGTRCDSALSSNVTYMTFVAAAVAAERGRLWLKHVTYSQGSALCLCFDQRCTFKVTCHKGST